MDMRTALAANTHLTFADGGEYVIVGELARGGSCIVYDGYYLDRLGDKKPVRIKECYPFKYRVCRNPDNSLQIAAADTRNFSVVKEKLKSAYRHGNKLFSNDASTNFTANTYNIYEHNNTLYIVSAYAAGAVLSDRAYGSLKDKLSVIRSVAAAISNLHDLGYLYLDLKPDNIYTFNETTELIQLFDFDTLLPIDISKRTPSDTDALISYTRGFAPLEQQMGCLNKIDRQSDVFGIGALLFYLIFGRTASADDCSCYAEYDYSALHTEDYRDKLFPALTEFFRHTIASFHLDRYPNMSVVIEKLDTLIRLSDREQAFVYSTKVHKPAFLVGREREAAELSEFLRGDEGCVFVVGMGGIGKSSLVREAVSACYSDFDTVVYINYKRTIKETIADDLLVGINLIKRDEAETLDDYFARKLEALRDIAHKQKLLFVIDNFDGDKSGCLSMLLKTRIKLIIVTRKEAHTGGVRFIKLLRISQKDDLSAIFRHNYGSALKGGDEAAMNAIIESVGGHTLTVELIAKQAASGALKLSEWAELVKRHGFFSADDSPVDYTRDYDTYNKTIREIISSLFENAELTAENRALLLAAAFFGTVSYQLFSELYGEADAARQDELQRQGWLDFGGGFLSVHPVIAEVVLQWKLSDAELTHLNDVMTALDSRLKPVPKYDNDRTAVSETEAQYLDLAERFCDCCRLFDELKRGAPHKRLLYHIIMIMPRERELDYTAPQAEEWLQNSAYTSDEMILDVCDTLSQIYCEHSEFERALALLKSTKPRLKHSDPHIIGRYHYIFSGYYDFMLDGNYYAATERDKTYFRLLLRETNRAVFYEKLRKPNSRTLAEYLRMKALLLIRSGKAGDIAIKKQLSRLNALTDSLPPDPLFRRNVLMANAWYHTYYERDFDKVRSLINEAYDISVSADKAPLDLIDESLYPTANIFFEWGEFDTACEYLERGIALCDEHPEIKAYLRKKAELLRYILEVKVAAKEYRRAGEIIGMIDSINSRLDEEVIYISEEIRNELT